MEIFKESKELQYNLITSGLPWSPRVPRLPSASLLAGDREWGEAVLPRLKALGGGCVVQSFLLHRLDTLIRSTVEDSVWRGSACMFFMGAVPKQL